jgi:hypothetical protein
MSMAGVEMQGALSAGTGATAATAVNRAAPPEQQQPVPRCSSVAELWSDLSPEEVQVGAHVVFQKVQHKRGCFSKRSTPSCGAAMAIVVQSIYMQVYDSRLM